MLGLSVGPPGNLSPQAASVLRAYVTQAPIMRPYFDVTHDSPIEDFLAATRQHPVFILS